jgi:hypothetical protein
VTRNRANNVDEKFKLIENFRALLKPMSYYVAHSFIEIE